jgi:PAS domain S-box-containing protein
MNLWRDKVTTSKKKAHRPRTIGEIIKSLREAMGMTPQELADSAQLSPSYIRKLERGLRHEISLDAARKLAHGLGVSPTVFFDDDVPSASSLLVPPANSHLSKQLMQWARNINAGMAELLREEERLRFLADATPDGIAVLDKGRVLFLNRQFLDMLGLPDEPDEFSGFDATEKSNLAKYVAPGSVARAHQALLTLANASETVDLLRADGTQFPVHVTGKIARYEGHQVLIVILRDLSDSGL